MLCSRCKREIPDGSMFCNLCGKRQAATTPPVQRKRRRRPKGSGTIYMIRDKKRKSPWVAVSGNGAYLGCFPSEGEARLAVDAANSQAVTRENYKLTLAGVYESFCHSPHYQKLGKSGKDGLSAAWERLSPLHARKAASVKLSEYQQILDTAEIKKRFKALTAAEIELLIPSEKKRYLKLLSQPAKPLGYDGKNRIKQLVSHLYNEMIRLEMIGKDGNLSDLLVLPPAPCPQKRNFTKSEKEILRAHDADEVVKIILIYIDTGMRLNELLKMKKISVDLERRIMIGGSKTEAGRNRIIPITDSIYPYVEHFYNKSNIYLIEEDNHPISDDTFRNRRFYPKLDELGIERKDKDGKNILTPHRTRHTMAADAITAGVSPVALTKVLGHSKFSTTADKYADDLDITYLHNEMEKMKKC